MNKIHSRWTILLTCITIILTGPTWAQAQQLATVWAEVYPAFGINSAHHTYLVAQTNNNQRVTCPCIGGDSGGRELAGTRQEIPAALLGRVLFMCNETPCAWPIAFWGAVGVCHQLANRGLYSVGSTVESAKGYGMSHYFFGVYGRPIRFGDNFDMDRCLSAAPRSTAQSSQEPNEQIQLYRDFRESMRIMPPTPLGARDAQLLKNYFWQSVLIRLRLALPLEGERLAARVHEYWNRNYDQQKLLLRRYMGAMLESGTMNQNFSNGMNRLLFITQDQFRDLFSPSQYLAFFNLPYPSDRSQYVDWSSFKESERPSRR